MSTLRHAQPLDESGARRARKELQRDIDRSLKQKDTEKIADLTKQLQAARAAHEKALASAADRCRALRKAASQKVKATRAQVLAGTRAKLRQMGDEERAEARGSCAIDRDAAEEATRPLVEGARSALAEERADQEGMKRIERGNRARRSQSKRSTAAERRTESDDEVRSNIPPELVGLFERVKRSIRGGARETRTEAFLRYAEEHPEEYLEAIDDRTDELIRELERRQREEDDMPARKRGRRNPATVAEAKKQYKRDHWGQPGTQKTKTLEAADPRIPSVELGELISVVYRTKKGNDVVLTDYEHTFNRPRPRLAYNETGLIVAGGKYRIESRGIVD